MRFPRSLVPITLLLGLELALCRGQAASQYCGPQGQAEKLHFTRLGKGRWLDPQTQPPGSLDPLYRMVRGFLDMVQLNPFPEGEERGLGERAKSPDHHRALSLPLAMALLIFYLGSIVTP